MTVVQHCEMKGRGKCGRRAISWVRWTYPMYKGTSSAIKAACAGCIEERGDAVAVIEPIQKAVTA